MKRFLELVDHELAVQGAERAPPMLRNRRIGLTPLERETRTVSRLCHAYIAGRGRAEQHEMRNEPEKSLPVVGADYGYLWGRSAEHAGDIVEAKDDDGDQIDGVRTSSRNLRDGLMFSPSCFKAMATLKETSQSSAKS